MNVHVHQYIRDLPLLSLIQVWMYHRSDKRECFTQTHYTDTRSPRLVTEK